MLGPRHISLRKSQFTNKKLFVLVTFHLIGLFMIRYEIVETFKQRCACLCIILPFHDKLRLRQHLQQVDQTITSLSRELFRIGGNIGNYCYN
jgi:hypothetical protein